MSWLKSYRSSDLLVWKIILRKLFTITAKRFFQLPTYLTIFENSHQYLLTIRIQCSTLMKLNKFFHFHGAIYNYNETQYSPYDATKNKIYSILRPKADLISNCAHIFEKTVSFGDILNFIDEENIVIPVDFDCGITFYHEAPTEIGHENREWKNMSRSFEKPKCISSNDQHNCSIDEEQIFNIFLKPYNLWDIDPAPIRSLTHTNDRDSLSNQYSQTKTHRPGTDSYPVFASLRTMVSKKKGLRISFAHFPRKTYRTDEWSKQLLRFKSFGVSGKPEQWMEFCRLWWSVVELKCS